MSAPDDYGFVDRLLHRLALGSPALAELSFDLDQKASCAAASADAVAQGAHVFVTGLARAGTTVLLREIHASGCFRSLTYRDMPFPLAPNLWQRFSARWHRKRDAQARAHGDDISVDADSPEALEELFWRVQCGEDYIRAEGLLPHRPDEEVLTLFRRYVAAIMASAGEGQTRYLSKNNNNILRLPALVEAFPQAWFVIPFRDPVTHALSLWRQHRHFCDLQRDNPFARSYMDWLVHHEFGLGQRPFLIGGAPPPDLSPDMPDYWLDLWTRVHATLINQTHERCLFVCHEDLCEDRSVWTRLAERLALPEGGVPAFALKGRAQPDTFSTERLREARMIHRHLQHHLAMSALS